jgi:hypothetical protein
MDVASDLVHLDLDLRKVLLLALRERDGRRQDGDGQRPKRELAIRHGSPRT